MSKCLKCDVNVNSVTNRCPLCDSIIDDTKDNIYPRKIKGLKYRFVRKISLFITLMCSLCVLLLNYYLTPDYRWSLFVVVQLLIFYILFFKILDGKNRVLRMLFAFNILVCFISIFWDIYIGFNGWSLDYVFPSLCITYGIFVLLLRFINYFAFRQNTSYIYFNICLGFVPLLLLYLDIVKVDILADLSVVIAFINLIILIIFDWSDLKNFIAKKFHL